MKLGVISAHANRLFRNEVTHAVRLAKRNYYSRVFEIHRGNAKMTWNHINKLIGKNRENRQIRDILINSAISNVEDAIADGFNMYFATVAGSLANAIRLSDTCPLSYLTPLTP